VGARYPEEGGGSLPLIEHWDGRTWSVVAGAAATTEREARLTAVAALSPDDVWVVGDVLGRGKDILEHWDGERWSLLPFPAPPRLRGLDGIVAIRDNDVWVLGHAWPIGTKASFSEDVFLHWNGRVWSLVLAPGPVDPQWGTSAVQSISAVGADAIWGVGGIVRDFSEAGHPTGPLVERWDGRTWQIVKAPAGDVTLSLVAASPDGDVWAARGGHIATVGAYGFGSPDFIYRWDGEEWSLVRRVRNGVVTSLVAKSSVDAWVVGASDDGHAFLDHWNGSKWKSMASSPNSPPTAGDVLPTATWAADGTFIALTADYPKELGGHDPNPNDVPNNYIWASCS
jgi:hypothetical protein